MAKAVLSEELWRIVQPLLPAPKPRPKGGRKPVPDKNALTGILYVLKTGIPWEYLPKEMGCGSGMTCWRRLRDWNNAGVWEKLQKVLLEKLQDAGKIDWDRAVVDSTSVRAMHRGKKRARAPWIGVNTVLNTMFSQRPRDVFRWLLK